MTELPWSETNKAVSHPTAEAFRTKFWHELRQDRWLYGLITAHAAAALLLAFSLGAPERLIYTSYFKVWLRVAFAAAGVYLLVVEVPAAIKASPGSPFAELCRRIPRLLTPRLIAGLLLLLSIAVFKGSFTSVKNLLPELGSFSWDVRLAELDAVLHGGVDPWRLLQPIMGSPWITRTVQHCYLIPWMLLLCVAPSYVAVSESMRSIRFQFFLTYILCWVVLGNIVAGLFYSAGPAFFSNVGGDPLRFQPLMDYLAFSDGLDYSSYTLQAGLWQLHQAGEVQFGTGISAFPSLHVAMATLFALLGFKLNRMAGWAATAFAVLIMAGSVHLGWHYAVDGYVSIAATLIFWRVAGLLGEHLPTA